MFNAIDTTNSKNAITTIFIFFLEFISLDIISYLYTISLYK